MKGLSLYINERLKFTKDFKTKKIEAPDNVDDLKVLVVERIKEDGPQADLNDIDVSHVDTMSMLFDGTGIRDVDMSDFNGDISEWDVSNVLAMRYMFPNIKEFNCDISQWDVSKCKSMQGMFIGCVKFNQDLSKWDMSNCTDTMNMFYNCHRFTGEGLGAWDMSRVTNAYAMFMDCTDFRCDVSGWDMSKCKDAAFMFCGCDSLNCDISKWSMPNVNRIAYMFSNCESLDCDFSKWKCGSGVVDWLDAFKGCDKLTKEKLPKWYKQ